MAVPEPVAGAVCAWGRWLSLGGSRVLASLLFEPLLSELLSLDVVHEAFLKEVEPVEEEEPLAPEGCP